jgi:hypothetical protein
MAKLQWLMERAWLPNPRPPDLPTEYLLRGYIQLHRRYEAPAFPPTDLASTAVRTSQFTPDGNCLISTPNQTATLTLTPQQPFSIQVIAPQDAEVWIILHPPNGAQEHEGRYIPNHSPTTYFLDIATVNVETDVKVASGSQVKICWPT